MTSKKDKYGYGGFYVHSFLHFFRSDGCHSPFFFLRSIGIPRKDDQKIISGIIYVLKFGLRWKDAPKEYGPYKTLYNRFVRWSNMGVFKKIFTALSESTQDTSLLMIDATCLKAHRTAASLRKKGLPLAVSDAQKED